MLNRSEKIKMLAWNKVGLILLAISILLPWQRAVGDFYTPLSPLLSPLLNELCAIVECGKGKCQASSTHTFGFVCECSPGWRQFHLGDHFRFLPCIIPNCSIDSSCLTSPLALPPSPQPPTNLSLFDPCMWAFCGGGKCSSTSAHDHICECSEGFSNILNASSFPCYRNCSFGVDCANLGINVFNSTVNAASPPRLSGNGSSSSGGRDRDPWIIIFLMAIVLLSTYLS